MKKTKTILLSVLLLIAGVFTVSQMMGQKVNVKTLPDTDNSEVQNDVQLEEEFYTSYIDALDGLKDEEQALVVDSGADSYMLVYDSIKGWTKTPLYDDSPIVYRSAFSNSFHPGVKQEFGIAMSRFSESPYNNIVAFQVYQGSDYSQEKAIALNDLYLYDLETNTVKKTISLEELIASSNPEAPHFASLLIKDWIDAETLLLLKDNSLYNFGLATLNINSGEYNTIEVDEGHFGQVGLSPNAQWVFYGVASDPTNFDPVHEYPDHWLLQNIKTGERFYIEPGYRPMNWTIIKEVRLRKSAKNNADFLMDVLRLRVVLIFQR